MQLCKRGVQSVENKERKKDEGQKNSFLVAICLCVPIEVSFYERKSLRFEKLKIETQDNIFFYKIQVFLS